MSRNYNKVINGQKFCRQCSRTLPIERFPQNGAPGRYRPLCKECTAANQRADEGAKARNRAYKKRVYLLKREELVRKAVAWNRANRERAREIQRASQKRSRQARPDQYRAVGRAQARRRLLGRNEMAVQYSEVLLRDPCAYCGSPASTVDHIDALAVGGTNEWLNLTAACGSCNSSKRHTRLLYWLAGRPNCASHVSAAQAARAEQNSPDE